MLAPLLISFAPQLPWAAPGPVDQTLDYCLQGTLLGDLNGDGQDDIVSLGLRVAEIDVALSNGSGGFSDPAGAFSPSAQATSLLVDACLDDATGDGNLDLVLLASPQDQSLPDLVLIAAGTGGGTFSSTTTAASMPPGFAFNVFLHDLDADGVQDLAVTHQGGPSRFMGLGGGQFGQAEELVAGGAPSSGIALGDVTGDGIVDLVGGFGIPFSSTFVFVGNGTLPFDPALAFPLAQSPSFQNQVLLDDLDVDGDPDIVIAGSGSAPGVWVVENLGQGAFANASGVPFLEAVPDLRLADLDGDGYRDIAGSARSFSGGAVDRIGVARGSATFQYNDVTDLAQGVFAFNFLDANGDGVVDLVTNSIGWDPIDDICALGIRAGFIDAQGHYGVELAELLEDRTAFQPLGAWDLDGDGLADPVFIAEYPRRVVWRHNVDGERFGPATTELFITATEGQVTLGDVNGDGNPDIIVIPYVAGPIRALFGNGQGGFGAVVTIGLVPPEGSSGRAVVTDLDLDGIDDVCWTDGLERRVFYSFGQASGLLSVPATDGGFASGAMKMGTGDIDGDGDVDIVLISRESVEVLPLLAPGIFGTRALIATTSAPVGYAAPVVGDADGDGISDILVPLQVNSSANSRYRLHWLEGLGGGAFAPTPTMASTIRIDDYILFTAGDLDQDGDTDLVATRILADSSDYAAARDYLMNEGGGSFADGVRATPTNIFDMRLNRALADIDSDGDLDILIGTDQGRFFIARNEVAGSIGESYCGPAALNASGQPGVIRAEGSAFTASNDVALRASQLPPQAFGYFLTSQTQGLASFPAGSAGTLCLGGAIGRYSAPSQIRQADAGGQFALTLDLTVVPTPQLGFVAAQAGDTWNFQAWFRDSSTTGQATSNFTDAVELGLR